MPSLIALKYLKKNNGSKIKTMLITMYRFFLDSILVPSIRHVNKYVDKVTLANNIAKTGLILM
jgi:hypothetical protein